jgi:hypothetical protein
MMGANRAMSLSRSASSWVIWAKVNAPYQEQT